MNNIFTLLPSGGWPRLLADAVWQSTLICTFGWLAARFCVRRQSAARAWLLLLTMTAGLLVPLASLAAREMGWTLFAARTITISSLPTQMAAWQDEVSNIIANRSTKAQEFQPPELAADVPAETATAKTELAGSTAAAKVGPPEGVPVFSGRAGEYTSAVKKAPVAALVVVVQSVFNWLGIAWLAAAGLLVLRLLMGSFATWRLMRRAETCDNPTLLAAASTAARRVGLPAVPCVLVSNEVQTPMVWAVGRPRLLVPTLDRIGEREIDWSAAFTHELAHVARGDGWARLWIELAVIALPLQPLMWILRRRFHAACEEACDDWAVASGADPVDLAAALTAWMNCRRPPAIVAAIGMSSSKARTLRLLALREKPVARLSRAWRWLGISTALLLIAGLAVAQTKTSEDLPSKATAGQKSPVEIKPQASQNADAGDVEKTIAEDPLITLYILRMQEWKLGSDEYQTELDAIKAGKQQADQKKQDIIRSSFKTANEKIKLYQEKIDKRKTELRTRIAQGLQETSEQPQAKAVSPLESEYVIEPPDILEITPIRLISKQQTTLRPFDKVTIDVVGTKLEEPIHGIFKVDANGEVVLGPSYGSVKITGLSRSEAQEAVKTQLEATLAAPEVALSIDESREEIGITGKHLVGPDGTINLGVYDSVKVAGQSVEQARKSVEKKLAAWFVNPVVSVDVAAFNSKVFYVIVQGKSGGDNIHRLPITGNDTLLDAIAQVPGLVGVSEAKIWIARPAAQGQKEQVIPIRWSDALSGSPPGANPRILPGDRIFIQGAVQQQGLPGGGSYLPPPTPAQSEIASQANI